ALWGETRYYDGTVRTYTGYLKNGFVLLSYRSTKDGYGNLFLGPNSGNGTEYIGHGQINSCPGHGFQVVKDCNMVIILAKDKSIEAVENEGIKRYKDFLQQACRDVKFEDINIATNNANIAPKACPPDKQPKPLEPLVKNN